MSEPAGLSAAGYRHPAYAQSLAAYGVPRRLEHSGGWILERPVPESSARDGMGVYPLMSCEDWSSLPLDLETLRDEGLVSLVLVSDPFLGARDRSALERLTLVRPFKVHYAAALDRPPEQIASRHHARCARKAARDIQVEMAADPLLHLDEWHGLYDHLVARHRVTGLRRFSRESFRLLLGLPGACLFRALRAGRTIGAQVFLQQDEVVHAHLAAFTPEGYAHGASYLLDWRALEHFQGRARVLNWGGGIGSDPEDGLARYKQGWSTEQALSCLLSAVLDPTRYASLVERSPEGRTDYFPAYRRGEFDGAGAAEAGRD